MHEFFPVNLEIFIKFGLTAILGLIIGLERELKRKPVGLKTSLVISIVSCLLTIVSIETAYISPGSKIGVNINIDPLRLAAQIISGIGFLGAGVILRRDNNSISGLTTAAIIWGAAGIGIAVGAGFYFEAILVALLLILSVEMVPYIMNYIGPKPLREKEVSIDIIVGRNGNIEEIIREFKNQNISVYRLRVKGSIDGENKIRMNIGVPQKLLIPDIYNLARSLKDVTLVEIDNMD